MSSKKFLVDPYRMRADFPELWARYLRETCGGRPALIAVQFDVTEETARNWLAGKGRATGDKVALAALDDPARFAEAMTRRAA